MVNKDYYKILGINKDADKKTIKNAYKKAAMKYHPDINKNLDAEEKFQCRQLKFFVASFFYVGL